MLPGRPSSVIFIYLYIRKKQNFGPNYKALAQIKKSFSLYRIQMKGGKKEVVFVKSTPILDQRCFALKNFAIPLLPNICQASKKTLCTKARHIKPFPGLLLIPPLPDKGRYSNVLRIGSSIVY